jgi:signal transduction histidine kinase
MRRYSFAFVVLLIPALLVGAGVLRLLARERSRAQLAERLQFERLATAACESVRSAVAVVEEPLLGRLRALPASDELQGLRRLREENPLVRNVFWFDETRRRLVVPDPERPAEEEDRYFVQRYESLFGGRVQWSDCRANAGREELSTLRNLRQLSEAVGRKGSRQAYAQVDEQSGWMVWFADEQLYKLGWVRRGTARFGVELESAMMVAQLTQMLPRELPPGVAVALLDGNRRAVHQVGNIMETDLPRPVAEASVGAELPHWAVAVYVRPGTGVAASRWAGLLGAIVAVLLIALILVVGWVLMREASRNWEEARRKTDFVANVSHELKTPLTAIRLHAEMLESGRVVSDEKRRHYLGVLVAESRRLARLVESVLTFSHLDRGRRALRLEGVDLAATLEEICATARPTVEAAGMRLETAVPEPCVVKADRDALAQCLHNLIDNAVKYAARGTVRIAVEPSLGSVRLRVCDEGPGIAPALRERVFEAFERADDSLTAVRQGVGLGLAITRRLVTAMGGTVRCEAALGGGACFVVELEPWREAQHERGTGAGGGG